MRRLLLLMLLAPAAFASDSSINHCSPDPKAFAVAGVSTPPENDVRTAYLGDYVTIAVCHLAEFEQEAATSDKDITLFVNGIDSGVKPSKIDLETGRITFTLDRNDANKSLWAPILYDPLFHRHEEIVLSAGEHGEKPLQRLRVANMRVTLDKLYLHWETLIWLPLLLAIVVACFYFGKHSDMLRDAPKVGEERQTYSIARVQMAWWFVLIVVAYVFIWLVTSDQDSIPPSLLGLMGISAATALAAVAVTPRAKARAEKLREHYQEHITEIDEKLAKAAVEPSLQPRVAELQAQRAELVAKSLDVSTNFKTRGFWTDLVTDDRGAVALDRLQVVVWTIVLGGIFVSTVLWELSMPEFSATMLALMGISSGTYIGFKLPEK